MSKIFIIYKMRLKDFHRNLIVPKVEEKKDFIGLCKNYNK